MNVEEVVADMVPGDAGKCLIGTPVATTMLPEDGKLTIRLRFPLAVLIPCPIARFSAFPAIRILVLTAVVNENGAGLSRSTT